MNALSFLTSLIVAFISFLYWCFSFCLSAISLSVTFFLPASKLCKTSNNSQTIPKEHGRRTRLKNMAEEHGWRTRPKNRAKEHGWRTRLKNTAEEHDWRTRLKNTAEEHGRRTGLKNMAEEHDWRARLKSTTEEHGWRTYRTKRYFLMISILTQVDKQYCVFRIHRTTRDG